MDHQQGVAGAHLPYSTLSSHPPSLWPAFDSPANGDNSPTLQQQHAHPQSVHAYQPHEGLPAGLVQLPADKQVFDEDEGRPGGVGGDGAGAGNGAAAMGFAGSAKSRGKKRASVGSPDVKLDENGQPKKKRKQLVACDSCRLRRVKCDRAEQEEGGACSECRKKGLNCTDTYVKSKPKVVRGGKLIQQAKLLYGEGGAPSASSTIPHPADSPLAATSSPASPIDPSSIEDLRRASVGSLQQQAVVLSKADGQLMGSQLQLDVAEQLTRTYFSVIHPQCPLVDQELFMQAFNAAGRDARNMGAGNECLALTLQARLHLLRPSRIMPLTLGSAQAWAARFSDNLLITGAGSPTLSDLRDPRGRDFTILGNRRNDFALAMRDRALRAVDERGILRQSSAAGVACLTLLEFLVTWDEPLRPNMTGRYLLSAAAEHLRNLQNGYCDDPSEVCVPPERLSNGTLLWMGYTRDALSSMFSGRSCLFTEDDLTLLCDLFTNPIAADPSAFISSTDSRMLSGLAVACIFRFVVNLIRSTVSRLTGPLARRQRVDPAVVQEIWAGIDESTRYQGIFRESVSSVTFGPEAPKTDVWFRDLVVIKAQHVLGVSLFLSRRLDEEEEIAASSPPADGAVYLESLRQLKQQADERMLSVAREYTGMLRNYGGDLLFSAIFSIEYSAHFLRSMVDSPAREQGGAESWTWRTKVEEVSALIEALKLIGWAWPSYDVLIESARTALAEQGTQLQQQKLRKFQTAVPYAPQAGYDLAPPQYSSDVSHDNARPTQPFDTHDWSQQGYSAAVQPPAGLVDLYGSRPSPPAPYAPYHPASQAVLESQPYYPPHLQQQPPPPHQYYPTPPDDHVVHHHQTSHPSVAQAYSNSAYEGWR
ncbi:hypothetical protein JCM10213v2_003126 [Rhodosporidiobolus nylandii]